MGDSHFCKWEFESPKEYSEKPAKQKKKRKKPKPQQQQTLCTEVGSALVVTDLSGLCLSPSVSVLVYALGFVSLLVAFLRLSELPLLSFLLNLCYPSLASIHAVPMPVPVPVPVPALLSALPSQCLKHSRGWGQIPCHSLSGVWVCYLKAAGGTVFFCSLKD